jgi:hypothetical protein
MALNHQFPANHAELAWVPVTETLPPAFVNVLVATRAGTIVCAFRINDGNWHTTACDPLNEVRFWMPLPSQP